MVEHTTLLVQRVHGVLLVEEQWLGSADQAVGRDQRQCLACSCFCRVNGYHDGSVARRRPDDACTRKQDGGAYRLSTRTVQHVHAAHPLVTGAMGTYQISKRLGWATKACVDAAVPSAEQHFAAHERAVFLPTEADKVLTCRCLLLHH